MKPELKILCFTIGLILCTGRVCPAEESRADSAEGLPEEYAKNYLVARHSMSRDKKFAVIYPTLDFSKSKDATDLVVSLEPFSVLGALPTEDFCFQSKSDCAIVGEWVRDNSVALIILESKWGPGDVFLVELADGKVKRTTSVLQKVRELLLPKFQAARPKQKPYNENYPFIFEPGTDYEPCTLGDSKTVDLDLSATNDPKSISNHPWRMRVKVEWDIAAAKFTSQKITPERGKK